MKTNKKIALAAMSLITAGVAAAGATGTFAWFAVNNTVAVTGMQVTTKVASNLLISPDTTEGNFKSALGQTREANLEPVSSIDGENFFYTTDAKASGQKDHNTTGEGAVTYTPYSEAVVADPSNALANTNAGKSYFDTAFNNAYGWSHADAAHTAYGYVDYDFYLKAISSTDNSKLVLKTCNMLYNGGVLESGDKAWRIAVFSQAGTVDTAYASAAQSLVSIIAPAGKDYWTDGKAVKTATALDDVTNLDDAVVIESDLDAGHFKYYHVTLRLWLEGEDENCNNSTYLTLTNAWTLNLEFQLDAGITGVSAIGSAIA